MRLGCFFVSVRAEEGNVATMARLEPLIKHAITPPLFDTGKVHRERLVDALHANVPRKLIVIAAPPGYGKTTLLADFASHTALPVVWVSLREPDRDLMRFAELLTTSLEKRFRRLKGAVGLESHVGSEPEGLARVFADVIDERVVESFAIILDDVHTINRSRAVLRFIDAFLEVLPEQATLILAGREVPEVSLARLMAEGDLAGFGPHDLALDLAELKQVAELRYGAQLDDQDAENLLAETRGWITGVLLSGKLSESAVESWQHPDRPMVYEYLASVVLQRQPEGMRRFMLDSSVMPVMTADACNEVLQITNSDSYLRKMLAEGLFVTSSGDSPRTYEYHPQFRDFLRQVANDSDKSRGKQLCRRAAQFLAGRGMVEPAVDLYLQAGSLKDAIRLASGAARAMSTSGRLQTLENWSSLFDQSGVSAPTVDLFLAGTYWNLGRHDDAAIALDSARKGMKPEDRDLQAVAGNLDALIALGRGNSAEAIIAAEAADKIAPAGQEAWLQVMNLRVHAQAIAAHHGDYHRARDLVSKAVTLLEGSGDQFSLAAALIDLSNFQAELGEMAASQATSHRVHEIVSDAGMPLLLGMSYNNLAVEAHENGRYAEALEKFRNGLKYARLSGSVTREAIVLYGQADLFNDLGLAVQSAELYGEALTIATRLNNPRLVSYGCLQTSVLHRRRGGYALAAEWLSRSDTALTNSQPNAALEIQSGRLEIKAQPAAAAARLSALVEQSTIPLSASEESLTWYFLGLARLAVDDLQGGQRALENAFNCAGANGTVQVVAAEMRHDREMLAFARKQMPGSAVLAIIQQRIETMNRLADSYREPGEQLDDSEELVLQALGHSEIYLNGRLLSAVTPFTRELLFYLVDHKRVERDQLIECFWPDIPPGRQTSNLHTAIYALRRAIGKDAIYSDGSAYVLNSNVSLKYDVQRFEHAAALAENLPTGDPRRLFALTEAINSFAGTYLEGFSSEWVIERRRRLEMRFLDLAAQYADEAILRNQPSRAVNTLRDALRIDPYRDDLNLRILEALGRLGRRSEIVSHYQSYTRLLADELGLDPPYAMREAYSRLIG